LIVDVLCINEAVELASKIASRHDLEAHVKDFGCARAIEDGLTVIRRQVTADLYFIRRHGLAQ
jgi:hypothetical protein